MLVCYDCIIFFWRRSVWLFWR